MQNISARISELKSRFLSLVSSKPYNIVKISAIVLAILLSMALSANAAEAGGGSSRGGGAGRRNYDDIGTSTQIQFDLQNTQWEYVGPVGVLAYNIGESSTNKPYNDLIVIPMNSYQITVIPSDKSIYYWLVFYDSVGQIVGTTPNIVSQKSISLPQNTSYVHVISNSDNEGRMLVLTNLSEEPPINNYRWQFNNLWVYSVYTENGYQYLEWRAIYPYEVVYGDTIKWKTAGSDTNLYITELDSSGKVLKEYSGYYYGEYSISNGDTRQISVLARIRYDGEWDITAMDSWTFTITNDGSDVEPYALDNTYYVNVNNGYYNDYSDTSNVTSGDGSTIVIVDGDGNEITIGAPNTSTSPATPKEEEEDDDGGGGFWNSILQVVKDLFGSLGDVLAGIIDILFIPIDFVINSVADLLELLRGTLASMDGLGSFFSEMFFFLPEPIPQMLTLFISAMLVVAVVKMFL